MAITSTNGWLAVRVPSVTTTFAEYVPDGVVLVATKERVPVNPPAAGTNCQVTPLGKLLAVTDSELAELAPLTVAQTAAGVRSCGATAVLVERDTVRGLGGIPAPPPTPVA